MTQSGRGAESRHRSRIHYNLESTIRGELLRYFRGAKGDVGVYQEMVVSDHTRIRRLAAKYCCAMTCE